MTGTGLLARRGVRAHRGALAATALVLVLAAAQVAMTGSFLVSGLTAGPEAPAGAGAELVAMASSFAGTALSIVLLVVASTVTLALRQRRRELALLRAVGATGGQVRRLVRGEVLTVTAVAAPVGGVLGVGVAWLLRPALADAGLGVPAPPLWSAPLPVVAATLLLAPTAALAARIAVRESLRLSPTAAVGGSAVEAREVGLGRRVAAVVLAVGGVAAACTPVLLPGTTGAAGSALSAFLLVGAAALAGPLLVTWTFDRAARLRRRTPGRGRATTQLALANVRGFSRRLTTVVVPLTLLLAVGTVQSTVDDTVARAATEQLRAAVRTDLVVTSPAGLTAAQVEAVRAVDGATVTPLATLPVQVRTDPDAPVDSSLAWDDAAVRVLPAGTATGTLDPDVVAGSLRALEQPGTVAISTDGRVELGAGLGDTVTWRLDGRPSTARVVAVFDRGLALGPLIVSDDGLRAAGVTVGPDTLLVDGAAASVRVASAAAGVEAQDVDTYVRAVAENSGGGRQLSTVLVLLLLGFAGIGAANAVVLATAGRRDELLVLRRTGATRRQLLATTGTEALVTGAGAWLIGAAAVLPAVVGMTLGLLGPAVPAVDLRVVGALSLVVVAIPLVGTLATVARVERLGGPGGDDHGRPTTSRGIVGRADDEEVSR